MKSIQKGEEFINEKEVYIINMFNTVSVLFCSGGNGC